MLAWFLRLSPSGADWPRSGVSRSFGGATLLVLLPLLFLVLAVRHYMSDPGDRGVTKPTLQHRSLALGSAEIAMRRRVMEPRPRRPGRCSVFNANNAPSTAYELNTFMGAVATEVDHKEPNPREVSLVTRCRPRVLYVRH